MVKCFNTLTIYKASAGSGKTFTLTAEYIKLLIKDPECYRNILAVTFTNKATEEMKMRILSMLYGLSKQLPEAQGYMDYITQSLGFAPIMVAKQSAEALNLLLHNYNYFKVETIDKFFQSVLRNMANELDLTANLHIGLNDIQVEEQAVDELIDSLNVHDRVFGWIMQYVKENISEDKGWNVINLIKRFGRNIFRDVYRENSKKITEVISTEGFFEEYSNLLKAIKTKAENYFNQSVETFFKILDDQNLEVSDFSNGSRGVCSYFIKMRKGIYGNSDLLTPTICEALEKPEKWIKKVDQKPGNPKYDLVCSTLMPLLQEIEHVRQGQARLHQSASLTLRHLNQLRLLGNIECTIRKINGDDNRFLLSDTQYLLNGIIQESDSPFIFEKIGTKLKHIMIDEFQDTSTIQWKNFKILLMDCMSNEGSHNLIVGDVKQSIYRWRSGDWKLLNNINTEFSQSPQLIKIESLVTNRRSDYNIVIFNNLFFLLAAKAEARLLGKSDQAAQLTQAYVDVEQTPYKTQVQGRIELSLMPANEYKEHIMGDIYKTIEVILQKGYEFGNIAILCRSKSTIQNIANYFCENYPEIPLVSDEAFRLDSSEAVNTIISSLRFIINPDNAIERAYLERCGIVNLIEHSRETLVSMPLYDMVQKIYGMIDSKMNTNQSAYIFAFFDQLSKFLNENMPDINNFIEEWDTNLHEKSIQSNENSGIRLLTIHKSKGLEFDHIIIPACDWKLEQQSTLWCVPKNKPFSQMPLVPIDFSKKNMENSIYEDEYYYEHLQNVVDNLNLLYVAFTRAKKSLYIFGKRGSATMRSALIEAILEDLALGLHTSYIGKLQDKNDSLHLEFGTLSENQSNQKLMPKEETENNVFQETYIPIDIHAKNTFKSIATFRQSNQSVEFVNEQISDEQNQYIKQGNVLHKIFSTIRTSDDIDRALLQLENEGLLYNEDIKREHLIKMLRNRLGNPKVSDWFSTRWTVINECSILFHDDVECKTCLLRPDRVITDGNKYIVIDFKFGSPKEEYHQQVKKYMHILNLMGHHDVKGYLWYVYSNIIEEVI